MLLGIELNLKKKVLIRM